VPTDVDNAEAPGRNAATFGVVEAANETASRGELTSTLKFLWDFTGNQHH